MTPFFTKQRPRNQFPALGRVIATPHSREGATTITIINWIFVPLHVCILVTAPLTLVIDVLTLHLNAFISLIMSVFMNMCFHLIILNRLQRFQLQPPLNMPLPSSQIWYIPHYSPPISHLTIPPLPLLCRHPLLESTSADCPVVAPSPMLAVDSPTTSSAGLNLVVDFSSYPMVLRPWHLKTANLVDSAAANTASTRVLLSPSSEPLAFSDANKYAVWHDAMCDEIKALHSNHTWSLVPSHPSMNVVVSRWVYRIKRRVDGSIERYKAHLALRLYPAGRHWLFWNLQPSY